jgi:hypothetical protein
MNKRRPFRFGDRLDCTFSMIYPLSANIKFLQFLIQQEFRGDEDLVRYFYWGGFHDGIIRIDAVDMLKSFVTMTFKNVSVLDQIDGATGNSRRPRHQDFFTTVTFKGVSTFRIECPEPLRDPEYHLSEFWKQDGSMELTIYFRNDSTMTLGRIVIKFKGIEVEDISKKLTKYKMKRRDLASWLLKTPPDLKDELKRNLELLERYRPAKKGVVSRTRGRGR